MAPTRGTRAPRAPKALLVLALLARAASAQPRIAGRFADMREACASVAELSTACKILQDPARSVMNELSNSTKPFTLFFGADGMTDILAEKVGVHIRDAICSNQRIMTKWTQGMWIPNRLLTACTLHALSLGSTPLVLATRLPREVRSFQAVRGPEPCTFKVQDATYTGNTYLVGKGILHTLQGPPPVVAGAMPDIMAMVPDIMAMVSVQASANAWSIVAAATSGMVGRLAAVFTRPTATNVACPAPELVVRLRGAYPELTACINAAVNGCAAGWGMPATILCCSNSHVATTFMSLAPGERDAKSFGQIEALVMKQLYIPGQRLGLADLSEANLSSLTAAAGNTIDVSCSDGSCSVRTSPSMPAAALVAEVPVGDGITLLVSSGSLWPRVA